MSDKSCPNCDEPIGICNGSYSQSCWQKKAEKLEARLVELGGYLEPQTLNLDGTDDERVAGLATLFSGALLDHAAERVTATKLPLVYRVRSENLGLLLKLAQQALAPVAILIHCPICHTKHIDEGAFATKKHHTHACQGFVVDDNGKRRRCGHVWRPTLVPTVGVEALPGFINEPLP